MARLSPEQAARTLHAGLLTRRAELEETIFARVRAIEDSAGAGDRRYVAGLAPAVSAGLDYGLCSIELAREGRVPEVSAQLLVQARIAAREGISLDTVLRRYTGANTVFFDVLMQEAERAELSHGELKRFYRIWASSFEHLLAAVSEEYSREAHSRPDTGEHRRLEMVQRLLDGELLDASDLGYGFDCWHLGFIAVGRDAGESVRSFAAGLDRSLLLVSRDPETVWAWLGGRRAFDMPDCQQLLAAFDWPESVSASLGEPAEGLAGWRLTHRQAAATLQIALRGAKRFARYSDMPLLASTLQDDLLASSLEQLYLNPLRQERDGGKIAKATLRAYLKAAGNVSSAAAELGVSRHTVRSRIAAIEERFGRPVDDVTAEIETALRLDDLGDQDAGPAGDPAFVNDSSKAETPQNRAVSLSGISI